MAKQFTKITSKEILGDIYLALEAGQGAGWVEPLAMRTSSSSASERYAWLSHTPKFREWKGTRQAKQLLEFDYTIRNKKYEATLRVEKDDLDRDKSTQLKRRIGELTTGVGDHWIELVSDLIQNYASYKCYDGAAFFANHAAEGDSGTTNNLLTATEAPGLNVGTATAPTATELTDALMDVVAYMMTYKDSAGRPINRTMRNFTIVCGNVGIWSPMQTAVLKDLLVSGGAATDNLLKKTGYNFEVVMNPFLTAASWTTTFTIYRADAPLPPFILQQESDIEVNALDENSDFYFEEDALLYGLKAKRNVGYGLYHYSAHCTLS